MAEDMATADSASEQQRDDPRKAAAWLDMIADAEKQFARYQESCDKVEKLYADTEKRSETADREFQIFWANLEVLKPSIYSRPPVPVVVPRFQNRTELYRRGAEMLERCLVSSFDADDIDATMKLARDDLAMNARGVIWCRYESTTEEVEAGVGADGAPIVLTRVVSEIVRKEHVDRRDFLHDPARKWSEVTWVARRSWLTREQGLKRFGEIFAKAEIKQRDDEQNTDAKARKAPVWELWDKTNNCVVWVSPGMEDVLDYSDPFLKLEGFFPCPRPAYGTLRPRTLKPVPDLRQYQDQIDEVNELTARISTLAESLRLKGFYPGGASDIGEAVEAVLKDTDNRAILVPISNLAMFGQSGGSLKDAIVWIPVTEVATVIKELVALRRQMIDDIYQITGISDIMRGTTQASETLGAQQLKSQYGSIRIRDRQEELVRLARDLTRIEAEIMAENFAPQTLRDMAQMTELPADEEIAQQISQITAMVQQKAADPIIVEQARANPQAAQQALQQAEAMVQQLEATVTLGKVVAFLREQRIRPFALDIETDSTIQPDENAAKQRATEFVTAVGGYMGQALPLVQQVPQSAPMVAEFLKYVASQFRAGRELQGTIDDFADQIKQAAGQQQGPSPEQEAEAKRIEADVAADQRKAELEAQKGEREVALKDRDLEIKNVDLAITRAKLGESVLAMTQPQMGEDGQVVRPGLDMAQIVEALNATAPGVAAKGDDELVGMVMAGQEALSEAMRQLAALLQAPKRLVRDQNGRPVGVEIVTGN